MSMDLNEQCPHCPADVGEICHETCSANGDHIIALKKVLGRVGLSLNKIHIRRGESNVRIQNTRKPDQLG